MRSDPAAAFLETCIALAASITPALAIALYNPGSTWARGAVMDAAFFTLAPLALSIGVGWFVLSQGATERAGATCAPRMWALALGMIWAGFWVADLHRADFRFVLLLVPFGLAAAWVVARLGGGLALWAATAAAVGASAWIGMEVGRSAPGVGSIAIWAALVIAWAGAALRASRSNRSPRTGGAWWVQGLCLAMGFIWMAASMRADNGCTGVSGAYSLALTATWPLLFAAGPWIAAAAQPSMGRPGAAARWAALVDAFE